MQKLQGFKVSLEDYPKSALEPDINVVAILGNQYVLIVQDFEVLVLASSTLLIIWTHPTSKLLKSSVLESFIHEQCDGAYNFYNH